MATTLTGEFSTRRDAEMTVERLVQEYGIERTDVFIAATGKGNSAGERLAGSDTGGGDPGGEDRTDAPLNGTIEVSVDVGDEALVARVRDAFAEFRARAVDQS